MMNRPVRSVIAACGILLFAAGASAEDKAVPWAEKDTRLASEYLNMLVEKPEYGRVLDLLWELYEKHRSSALLLDSIAAQVNAQPYPSVRLVHAHLLRKAGRLEEAQKLYQSVLHDDAKNIIALRALADIALEQSRRDEALAFLQRIADAMPVDDPSRATLLMEKGRVALETNKPAEAAAAWEAAVKLQPDNAALQREVAQLFLGSGFLDRALAIYRQLAKSADPAKRLDALYDLSRIEEQSDHLKEAAVALRDGMALLHFRDRRYRQFFARLVKLHERFGQLDGLKAELLKAAQTKPPQEKALADMAAYAELTVDPEERMKWLRELVRLFPDTGDYRWQLVTVLIDHDGWKEAGEMLDSQLKGDGDDAPALVLLRAMVDLRAGEEEKASNLLKGMLKKLAERGMNLDVEKQVLSFARGKSLDVITEMILRARVERDPDKAEAVMELAGFYRSRQKLDEAGKLLDRFAAAATTEKEKRDRMNQVAVFLSNGGAPEIAEKAARDAAKLPGAGREEILRLADVLAQNHPAGEVLPLLERAWTLSDTAEKQADVDERIVALLSDEPVAAKPAPAEMKGEFKLPAIFTGDGFGSEAPAEKKKSIPESVSRYALAQAASVSAVDLQSLHLPQGLSAFAKAALRNLADALSRNAKVAPTDRVLRAAWWAFRSDMSPLAASLLWRLGFDPSGSPVTPPVEALKMWLDLAQEEKNTLLAVRTLRLLSKLDPANLVTWQMRLAEQEMAREGGSGRPVAMGILEQLVRDESQNVSALTALAQCYMVEGFADKVLALWQKAVREAKGNTGPLLERYADALITQRKFKEFIETQTRLLEEETDLKRRRENFQRALERLMWADSKLGEITEDERKRRLDMTATVLRERAQRHPFDGFWHEALAQVHDRLGEAKKAFEEMKRAYYTAPDTPFSLDQLRAAALRVGDLKSAIYFQKQIAAASSSTDGSGEWRELVQLLEQDFRIGEADQVRRRIESRFSQDTTALEELAKFYAESAQDDAAQRVLGQIARVKPWETKNLFRLALAQERIGARGAAKQTLLKLLASSPVPPDADGRMPVERWPWPMFDERKLGAMGHSTLITALENLPGLETPERDRLRAFVSLPRGELAEIPDEPAHVRLRAMEMLAKLDRDAARSLKTPNIIERAWLLFYAGTAEEFVEHIAPHLEKSDAVEARFAFLWLSMRAHAVDRIIEWVQADNEPADVRWPRKKAFRGVTELLAECPGFDFTQADLDSLGRSQLIGVSDLLKIANELDARQRHADGLVLREAARRQVSHPPDWFLLQLATRASAAGRDDLFERYMRDIWEQPVISSSSKGDVGLSDRFQEGGQESDPEQRALWFWNQEAQSVEPATPRPDDPFIFSFATLLHSAKTPDDRAKLISDTWKRLHQVAPSGQIRMREGCVLALSGAEDAGEKRIADYLSSGYLSAHPFVEPVIGRLPQGVTSGPRIDEVNHMRGYWENVREWGAGLRNQGLGALMDRADRFISSRNAGTRLGQDFNTWRTHVLARRMKGAAYPERMRLLRAHLTADDTVDTLIELGNFLESQGFARECMEIYRRLYPRAPSNSEYAESYVRAGESSWDVAPVIPYLVRLFDPAVDPVFKPLNFPFETLREKHAKFLAMTDDVLQLRLLAFKVGPAVKMGRVPEEVPYLRELAPLLEREGDMPGALAAWEQLSNLWPDEEEATVHRARILVSQGNRERALEALRKLPLNNLWSEQERAGLELRVKLAADAGLWSEVRDLMNIVATPPVSPTGTAPVHQTNTVAVVAVSRVLADHQRTEEARSLLIRAERGAKDEVDRFRLRMEQLEVESRAPSWSPSADPARVLATVRMNVSDEAALKEWRDWMKREADLPRAKAWFDLLNNAEPNINTALGLAALNLAAKAKDGHFSRERWTSLPQAMSVARELTADTLMERKLPQLALQICRPSSPPAVRAFSMMGDEIALREIFSELVRMPSPGGGEVVKFAETFAATHHEGLADELFALAMKHIRDTAQTMPPLVKSYANFLIAQKRHEAAETLLVQNNAGLTDGLAEILVELYRGWGRLDHIEAELAKFHLPSGVLARTKHLAARETVKK